MRWYFARTSAFLLPDLQTSTPSRLEPLQTELGSCEPPSNRTFRTAQSHRSKHREGDSSPAHPLGCTRAERVNDSIRTPALRCDSNGRIVAVTSLTGAGDRTTSTLSASQQVPQSQRQRAMANRDTFSDVRWAHTTADVWGDLAVAAPHSSGFR